MNLYRGKCNLKTENINYLAVGLFYLSCGMRNTLILLLLLSCVVACTPYNSDKVNKQLLQGRWLMQDTYYISSDSSIISEYSPGDSIILLFDEDRYKEYFSNGGKEINLRFDISDYRIMFYKDSSIFDWTNIDVLSPDSLVLSKANRIWQYKKIP